MLCGGQIQPEEARIGRIAIQKADILGGIAPSGRRVGRRVAPVVFDESASPEKLPLFVDSRRASRSKLLFAGNALGRMPRADIDHQIGPDRSDAETAERTNAGPQLEIRIFQAIVAAPGLFRV